MNKYKKLLKEIKNKNNDMDKLRNEAYAIHLKVAKEALEVAKKTGVFSKLKWTLGEKNDTHYALNTSIDIEMPENNIFKHIFEERYHSYVEFNPQISIFFDDGDIEIRCHEDDILSFIEDYKINIDMDDLNLQITILEEKAHFLRSVSRIFLPNTEQK